MAWGSATLLEAQSLGGIARLRAAGAPGLVRGRMGPRRRQQGHPSRADLGEGRGGGEDPAGIRGSARQGAERGCSRKSRAGSSCRTEGVEAGGAFVAGKGWSARGCRESLPGRRNGTSSLSRLRPALPRPLRTRPTQTTAEPAGPRDYGGHPVRPPTPRAAAGAWVADCGGEEAGSEDPTHIWRKKGKVKRRTSMMTQSPGMGDLEPAGSLNFLLLKKDKMSLLFKS
ncbi:uncharacterized protein LOC134738453 [Pongo pygmaeus]|uniref:uncharacterized protein LOC134738453 n=1 Tax=Pongo pygmaeus TaxID=9600 RepID=UPI00300D2AC0